MEKQLRQINQMYSGFLGMCAGIRLGAPVEPVCWTAEKIKEVYGDITHYTKYYKNFAADDDSNGPVYFIRALSEYAKDREMTAEDVGNAWLDFSREGIGMFWWGGDQVSTEHTAFLNLKRGMKAPASGSIETNGIIMAEQIGGQIFIDTWGMLFPESPTLAANYAEKAASVSHDQNGLFGARFMAACVSEAFRNNNILEIINRGLEEIPKDSLYAQVTKEVIAFYQNNPNDFRSCRQFLEENWGYDKYTGVCHIIPNAGVCILALLYGEGDLARTIEIATMCAWDTDCNAGNVGTILGVMNGLEGVPAKYREPINDFIVTSSVIGTWNILDVPTFVKELAKMSFIYNKQTIPPILEKGSKQGRIEFDFELLGSTHGFRTDNSFKTELQSHDDFGENSMGSLSVLLDRLIATDESHIFYKPFYRREDFSDERYKPTFAPQVLSGQILNFSLYLEKWQGENVYIQPYVRVTYGEEYLYGRKVKLESDNWKQFEYIVPDTHGSFVDEIGFKVSTDSPLTNRTFGRIFLDNFNVTGQSEYEIDFSKQAIEFLCVTPFSHNLGQWELENNRMKVTSGAEGAAAYTGNYYAKDIQVETVLTPLNGNSHMLHIHSKGVQRGYFVGFNGQNTVQLIHNQFGKEVIKEITFDWSLGQNYQFKLSSQNGEVVLSINDQVVLSEILLSKELEGMYGYVTLDEGKCLIDNFYVKELS